MHSHEQPGQPAPENADPRPDAGQEDPREADEDFRQWVALVVLLACWLAEAYM
jgi:hypothetical protein